MRIAVFIILLLIAVVPFRASCQQYDVLRAKHAYLDDGDRIRKGDKLVRSDVVSVRKKGTAILGSMSEVHFKLKPGIYNIDSLMTLHEARRDRHDSLRAVLLERNLLDCQFRYRVLNVPGSDQKHNGDRIDVFREAVVNMERDRDDLLTIQWSNPDNRYRGDHLIIIQDPESMWYVDVFETGLNEIRVDFGGYGYENLQYLIKAEDCRASLIHGVRIVP